MEPQYTAKRRTTQGAESQDNDPQQGPNLNGSKNNRAARRGHVEPYETFNFAGMAALPRRRWIIRYLLLEETISNLSADGGSFKTFIALCMALCIATGTPFFGREVTQGSVVYIAAEGFYTLHERALAWSEAHSIPLPEENFTVLRVPVNLADPVAIQRLIATVQAQNPLFIVLDTLSQNATGLNENSNDEMAIFIAGMAQVGRELGAHVMAVHHNAKATGSFRGAGAIKNNVDTHITLEKPEEDGTTVFVRCEKQRGKPFEPFALLGREVETSLVDEFDEPVTSLVFEACTKAVTARKEKHASTKKAEETREALLAVFDELAEKFGGVKIGMWKGEVEARNDAGTIKCGESSFWAWRKKFELEGIIKQCGTHHGSELYARPEITPSTPSTPNEPTKSARANPLLTTPTTPTTSLDVGVVGVSSGAPQSGAKTANKKARKF